MCLAMRVAILALVSVLAFSGCRSKDEGLSVVVPQNKNWPGYFVDGAWVAGHWEGLVIVDARDAESYEESHLPSAIHLSASDVERRQDNGRLGLLPLQSFEDLLGGKGLDAEARIVIYGEAGDGQAARLMWALDVYGHERVALLVEGIEGWESAGFSVDQVPRTLSPSRYRATMQPDRIASAMTVMDAIGQPQVGLFDLRSSFYQERRIPTSVSLNFEKSIMEPESLSKVRELQNALGKVTRAKKRLLTYGNPNSRAYFTYFALRDLGLKVCLYPGGWEEWTANSALPVELGDLQPVFQKNDYEQRSPALDMF